MDERSFRDEWIDISPDRSSATFHNKTAWQHQFIKGYLVWIGDLVSPDRNTFTLHAGSISFYQVHEPFYYGRG